MRLGNDETVAAKKINCTYKLKYLRSAHHRRRLVLAGCAFFYPIDTAIVYIPTAAAHEILYTQRPKSIFICSDRDDACVRKAIVPNQMFTLVFKIKIILKVPNQS